jgi:tetratricopeptide (TPR) repeat protein
LDMKSSVCGVVLVCVLGLPALGQSPATMDCEANAACVALVEQAQQQSKAGQLAEAEKSYKLAYEVSHDPRLLFNIARVLDKRGQGKEATTYYQQFIEAPVEDQEQKMKAREYVAQLEAKTAPRQPPPPVPVVHATTPLQPVASTPKQDDKPIYKRGWFWGVIAGSAAAVGLGIGLGVGLSNRVPTVPGGTNTAEPTF